MHVIPYGKATKAKIKKAAPFTLFKGNPKGKKKGHWETGAVFQISWKGFSREVYEQLDEMGIDLGYEYEPEYEDELRLHDPKHKNKDDSDAWIPALDDGWDLVKVPDRIGCKYYRLMITNYETKKKKKKKKSKKAA